MKIAKEHAGKYEIRNGRNLLVGHIVKTRVGWIFEHISGGSTKTARASPGGAVQLAIVAGLIATVSIDWMDLIRRADAAFGHNVAISVKHAR